jgi:hypothetical protein
MPYKVVRYRPHFASIDDEDPVKDVWDYNELVSAFIESSATKVYRPDEPTTCQYPLMAFSDLWAAEEFMHTIDADAIWECDVKLHPLSGSRLQCITQARYASQALVADFWTNKSPNIELSYLPACTLLCSSITLRRQVIPEVVWEESKSS